MMKPIAAALLAVLSLPTQAADLLQIYRDALANDPIYASARAALAAGQEKLPQGRSLLLPTVALSGSSSYTRLEVESRNTALLPNSERRYNTNNLTLSLTQPVYRPANWVQYAQAELQVNLAETQWQVANQDLILRVAQAYFDVLLAQDNVALAGAQKNAIAEQLAQAKRNFEVGTATITDTHEAQARFDAITAQEIAAQNDLEIKRNALQQIIGKVPDSFSPVTDKLPLTVPEPVNLEKWLQAAEETSLQIRAQRIAQEVADREVERNRAGHHPTVDLVASYTKNGQQASSLSAVGTDSDTRTITLQLAVPLYAGGAISSKVREAVANQEKARQDTESARRATYQLVRQAFLGVTSGVAQVKALEQALVSGQTSLESTKLGQEVGVRTNVDVLNATQQLFSAKRDLSQARYNYVVNNLRLRAAVGGLNEETLTQVNAWLGSK